MHQHDSLNGERPWSPLLHQWPLWPSLFEGGTTGTLGADGRAAADRSFGVSAEGNWLEQHLVRRAVRPLLDHGRTLGDPGELNAGC